MTDEFAEVSMEENKLKENLIYLNTQRQNVLNSKQYFWGNKVYKYVKLVKSLAFISIVKELTHDGYAFFAKRVDSHKIIDFRKDQYKGNAKIVVYTCIYGKYDSILEPLYYDPKCEYYIFTDQVIPEGSIWKKEDDLALLC